MNKYTREYLELELPKIKKIINKWSVNKNPGIKRNQDIKKTLNLIYPFLFKNSGEIQFWFQNINTKNFLSKICCVCGQKKKWLYAYPKYCGRSCYMKYEGTDYLKNLNLKNYGVTSSNYRPSVREKIKSSMLELNILRGEEVKKCREVTCLQKYGQEFPTKNSVIREKISEIQKNRNHTVIQEIQTKIYQTKKKNNSFNTSKAEQEILVLLQSRYPDTKYQYMDTRYPFNCDFYIPSIDLFIEYHGSWTHGGEAFVGSKEQLLKVRELEQKSLETNFKGNPKDFYKNVIYTWTVLDVKKRETVKNNKLNFLEFFNVKQFMEWFENAT